MEDNLYILVLSMDTTMLQESETSSGIIMNYICIQAEDRDERQPLHLLAAQYGYINVAGQLDIQRNNYELYLYLGRRQGWKTTPASSCTIWIQ